MLLLALFINYAALVASQRKWYYTGESRNQEKEGNLFSGMEVNQDKLFEYHSSNETMPAFDLFCGHVVLNRTAINSTLNDDWLTIVNDQIMNMQYAGATVFVTSAVVYEMLLSINYDKISEASDLSAILPLRLEIGLYDHQQLEFIERHWRNIVIGELVAIQFKLSFTHSSGDGDNYEYIEEHRLVLTCDKLGRRSLVSHTWKRPHTLAESQTYPILALNNRIRVMTFNLWHNNPASWVYHDTSERWDRYDRRLRHFADTVVEHDPDVVTIQEVRIDTAFSNSAGYQHWSSQTQQSSTATTSDDAGARRKKRKDGGSQVDHLMYHLAEAHKRKCNRADSSSSSSGGARSSGEYNNISENPCSSGTGGYQFVFRPGMSMVDRNRFYQRNEEGALIISKYAIDDSRVIFLPRDTGNPQDDHQRLLLEVKLKIPLNHPDGHMSGQYTTVDVMTSHFSLLEASRDRTVEKIVHLVQTEDLLSNWTSAPIQILTGDFNGEPHEDAMRRLLDRDYFLKIKDGENSKVNTFVDSWVVANPDATEQDGYTFPACNPIKRIDYILIRNNSILQTDVQNIDITEFVSIAVEADGSTQRSTQNNADGRHVADSMHRLATSDLLDAHAVVTGCRVVGQEPTEDTKHLLGSRPELGMLDLDSPIWSSDHFAVVTDILIKTNE